VYRVFSWRDRGVDVVGRTRWLRIPYRNTKQIFQAAYHLAQSNPVAMQMIAESGERVEPNFDAEELREGDFPLIKEFDSVAAEKAFIREKIQTLLEEGFMAKEIALFHDKDYVRKKYQRHLPRGITVDEPRRQTGMEYRAVFIPQIQNLFERDTNLSWKKAQAKQQYLFYTAMTRARDKLYMTYQQKWPKYLQSFSEYAHVIRN
jgi:superfamily I DNA/RNA helicase